MSSLVTTDQFATYLKQDLTGYDACTADLMLDGATAAVIEYCGWHIAPVITETVRVDGTGTLIQTLPTMNLLALNHLDECGLYVNTARIDWSTNGLLEKRSGSVWTRRRRGIVAEITHGYPTTPAWLLTLICALAGRAFAIPFAPARGIMQESAGGESVTYATAGTGVNVAPAGTVALMPLDRRMLDRIRVPLGP